MCQEGGGRRWKRRQGRRGRRGGTWCASSSKERVALAHRIRGDRWWSDGWTTTWGCRGRQPQNVGRGTPVRAEGGIGAAPRPAERTKRRCLETAQDRAAEGGPKLQCRIAG